MQENKGKITNDSESLERIANALEGIHEELVLSNRLAEKALMPTPKGLALMTIGAIIRD